MEMSSNPELYMEFCIRDRFHGISLHCYNNKFMCVIEMESIVYLSHFRAEKQTVNISHNTLQSKHLLYLKGKYYASLRALFLSDFVFIFV